MTLSPVARDGQRQASTEGTPALVCADVAVRFRFNDGSGTWLDGEARSLPHSVVESERAVKAALSQARLDVFRRMCLVLYDGGLPEVRKRPHPLGPALDAVLPGNGAYHARDAAPCHTLAATRDGISCDITQLRHTPHTKTHLTPHTARHTPQHTTRSIQARRQRPAPEPPPRTWQAVEA